MNHISHIYYHHSGGFGDMVMNSLIHSFIYSGVHSIFHGMGIIGSVLTAIVAVLILGVVYNKFLKK